MDVEHLVRGAFSIVTSVLERDVKGFMRRLRVADQILA